MYMNAIVTLSTAMKFLGAELSRFMVRSVILIVLEMTAAPEARAELKVKSFIYHEGISC